jgi:hypothetical protein
MVNVPFPARPRCYASGIAYRLVSFATRWPWAGLSQSGVELRQV